MSRSLFAVIAVLAFLGTGCGGGEERQGMSTAPVSVRGWVDDIRSAGEPPPVASSQLVETNRLMELFRSTTIAVAGVEFATGGFSEMGTFVALDVPPGKSTLVFQVAGRPDSFLVLENVPPSADVLLPQLFIQPPNVRPVDFAKVMVRIPGKTSEPRKVEGKKVLVAGSEVAVWEVPISDLADRRGFPERPMSPRPIGYVR